MNLEYIEQSKEIYYNAELEYQRYYFDEGAGGFVLVHSEHNLNDSERFVAEVLAKMGKRVILLSERAAEGVKTPDANIDGEVWEFKELTQETANLKDRVQDGLRDARRKGAMVVVYHINRDEYDVKKINAGIQRALEWDVNYQIQSMMWIDRSGETQTISRQEWMDGKRVERF
ncbi:hypothetical protein [Kamptonema sp. PCC 6506]|uniref:CdiA C-terminal domain-containing protein n=2 Tax=Kamptonema TaxID=1501433 RepID=UPI0001DAD12C|nr:hypothetical protein [Kamptonema sp. PCC 6506]CBN59351.1 hypothetical protein OSCI_4120030 [Kamptonema sp. PCC 6506]